MPSICKELLSYFAIIKLFNFGQIKFKNTELDFNFEVSNL